MASKGRASFTTADVKVLANLALQTQRALSL